MNSLIKVLLPAYYAVTPRALGMNTGYTCISKLKAYKSYVCNMYVRNCEGVYEPSDDTFVAARLIEAEHGDKPKLCVDIGTGTGALSLCMLAQSICPYVVATDIDACAVYCAKYNTWRSPILDVVQCNGVSCIRPMHGVLLVFNSPYLPPGEIDSTAWSGGARVVKEILTQLEGWRCWRMLLIASSASPWSDIEEFVKRRGLRLRVVERRWEDFFVETIAAIIESRCA